MHFRTFIFTLFGAILSHPCVFEKGIDLRSLSKPSGYFVEGNIGTRFDFFINICSPVQNPRYIPCNGDRSMASIMFHFQNSSNCNAISRTGESPNDVEVKWLDPNNHDKGVLLAYYYGRHFQHERGKWSSRTEIEIICNKYRTTQPKFKSQRVDLLTMVFTFTMESIHACPNHDQKDVCMLKTSQGIIDLTHQAYSRNHYARITSEYESLLNICVPVDSCTNKLAPAVFLKNNSPNDCLHISNTFSKENISLKLKDEQNPKAGVILTYLNGENFEHDGRDLPTETEFDITCDPNVRDDNRPIYKRIFDRNGKNVIFFELKSKFVCL